MLSNAVSSSWAFSLALLVLWGCRWQIWQLRPARASILPSPRFCDIMWHPFVETTGWSNLAKLSGVQSVILARHMLDVRKLREAHLEDDASKFSKSDGLILQKNPGNRTMAWQNYGMALWNILTATLPWHQGRIILEWNNIDQPSLLTEAELNCGEKNSTTGPNVTQCPSLDRFMRLKNVQLSGQISNHRTFRAHRYSEKKLEAIQRIPTVVTDGRKETSHVSGAKANAANRVSQTVKQLPRWHLCEEKDSVTRQNIASTCFGSHWRICWWRNRNKITNLAIPERMSSPMFSSISVSKSPP